MKPFFYTINTVSFLVMELPVSQTDTPHDAIHSDVRVWTQPRGPSLEENCGGLNENVPHGLQVFGHFVPSWWCCFGISQKVCHAGRSMSLQVGLENSKALANLQSLSASCTCLEMRSSAFCPCSGTSCLPTMMEANASGTVNSNKLFLL